VVDKMAVTFLGLVDLADFSAPRSPAETDVNLTAGTTTKSDATNEADGHSTDGIINNHGDAIRLGGFVYNVELHLPESRDPAVYEALFRALKTHLLS
jgi:hypothetical protein